MPGAVPNPLGIVNTNHCKDCPSDLFEIWGIGYHSDLLMHSIDKQQIKYHEM